jgi:hypothetical protein
MLHCVLAPDSHREEWRVITYIMKMHVISIRGTVQVVLEYILQNLPLVEHILTTRNMYPKKKRLRGRISLRCGLKWWLFGDAKRRLLIWPWTALKLFLELQIFAITSTKEMCTAPISSFWGIQEEIFLIINCGNCTSWFYLFYVFD